MPTRALRTRALVLSLSSAVIFVVGCDEPSAGSPIAVRGDDGAMQRKPGAAARPATPAAKPGAEVERPIAWPSPEASVPEREAAAAELPATAPPPMQAPLVSIELHADARGPADERTGSSVARDDCVCPIELETEEPREASDFVRDERRYRHPDGSAVRVAGGPPEGFERQPGTRDVYGRASPGGFERDPRGADTQDR